MNSKIGNIENTFLLYHHCVNISHNQADSNLTRPLLESIIKGTLPDNNLLQTHNTYFKFWLADQNYQDLQIFDKKGVDMLVFYYSQIFNKIHKIDKKIKKIELKNLGKSAEEIEQKLSAKNLPTFSSLQKFKKSVMLDFSQILPYWKDKDPKLLNSLFLVLLPPGFDSRMLPNYVKNKKLLDQNSWKNYLNQAKLDHLVELAKMDEFRPKIKASSKKIGQEFDFLLPKQGDKKFETELQVQASQETKKSSSHLDFQKTSLEDHALLMMETYLQDQKIMTIQQKKLKGTRRQFENFQVSYNHAGYESFKTETKRYLNNVANLLLIYDKQMRLNNSPPTFKFYLEFLNFLEEELLDKSKIYNTEWDQFWSKNLSYALAELANVRRDKFGKYEKSVLDKLSEIRHGAVEFETNSVIPASGTPSNPTSILLNFIKFKNYQIDGKFFAILSKNVVDKFEILDSETAMHACRKCHSSYFVSNQNFGQTLDFVLDVFHCAGFRGTKFLGTRF